MRIVLHWSVSLQDIFVEALHVVLNNRIIVVLVVIGPDLIKELLEVVALLDAVQLAHFSKYLASRLEALVLREDHSFVLLACLGQEFGHLVLDPLLILDFLILLFDFLAVLFFALCLGGLLSLLLLLARLDLGLRCLLDFVEAFALELLCVCGTIDPLGMRLSTVVFVHEVFDFSELCLLLFSFFIFLFLFLLFFGEFGFFCGRLGLNSLRVIRSIIVALDSLVRFDRLLHEGGDVDLLQQRLNGK